MPKLSAENKELITAAVRDKAFACACAMLREAGWRRFTMKDLAVRMGVAKGTVYNYFRDKDAVILFIRETLARQIAARIRRDMARESDTRRLLRRIVLKSIEGMKEFRFLHFAIGDVVMRRAGPEGTAADDAAMDCVHDVLAAVMERGMKDGSVRPGDPVLMAGALHSSLMGVEMGSRFHCGLDTNSQKIRELIADLLLRGICTEEK
ncbi:MAG: TetR/AcrR family transcriptional regulator [Pyramidobacter porci]|uniref:TetR/AcrR family transcriptional regulator n=1 Tax=Pyramidobacter porci TaxID=2605789 RepID=UPI002A762480|nr:TetR/AcrR family transcriptional regulator [Pyramidobacter porci]MDY2648290.1 TetR/AcrR family transcriptional regulator [Pyramidobacter porci]